MTQGKNLNNSKGEHPGTVQVCVDSPLNDAGTCARRDTPLTQVESLSVLITHLIGKRRREPRPEAKMRLQVLIEQLQTKQRGDGGPDLDRFIQRQLVLVEAL